MSVTLVKLTPISVTAIGDDGKNPASNLFDQSLENRWSYKGKFAYNLIKLSEVSMLDNIMIYWYMKKKENRKYDFGIYLSKDDINIPSDFDAARVEVQKYYDDVSTMKPLSNNGEEVTTLKMSNREAKSILIIYTKSSSKKNWFSVKEIAITGTKSAETGECPEGKKWDPISGQCVDILPPDDQDHIDSNGVTFFEEDGIEYISENHTYHKNFRSDGSMRLDVEPADMGNQIRYDKEVVVFLRCQKTKPDERVNLKSDGGPHTPTNPPLGRCEDFGIQFDGKKAIFEQELRHEGGGGGPYIDRDEVDTSGKNLPPISSNWYGFLWRDRRFLRKSDNKLLGRLLQIKLNPNPFDNNRNVLNANWVDITAFIDKGQYKDDKGKPFPIIDGPVDNKKYQDTVRVDGQNASTFGVRFFRYCGVKPIMVDDEAEMEKLFKEARGEDTGGGDENKPPKAVVASDLINVTQDGQQVTLDASKSTDPEGGGLTYQWKQMQGATIPLSDLALTSPTIQFNFNKDYETSVFAITVTDNKGATSSSQVKVVNAINQNPETKKYIDPKYQADLEYSDLYFRMSEYLVGKTTLADGKRVPTKASKWDLKKKPDGSVYYNAGTGRLKIYAIDVKEDQALWDIVEAQNPEVSYDKARQLGRWGRKGFGNVECTAILTFDKQQPRADAFVGWVVRSFFHDLKTDPESKGHQHRYHGGSAYHSNIQVGGKFEEKIEGGHAIYYDAKKIYTYMTNIPNLAGKKVGWKFCLQNTMFDNKPIVLSQTYITLQPDDTDPHYAPWWSTIYYGNECPSGSIQADNKNVDKLDVDPGLITWESDYIILKSNDSKMTFHEIEIKPIIPIPEIKTI